jgi:hypothetical protein
MANKKVAARLQVGPSYLLFFIDETVSGGCRYRRAMARDEGRPFRR